ncbi:helix-turn-helix domain-containing protein [Streptomyces formicae]|uniref:Helix-turn-helix transcriptional regulator n=1 Tax=Streptomyces formicae TaxID=1616117 RepID=A0ABY3WSJ0_9ACTN|nr:helix-turn-helix transcriptional regulator [Streptomyces formicae]UNM15070.1 helix-turn-helix transcriptional regulator [Streptomyces formicae]
MANAGKGGRWAGSRQAAWEFFGLELKARREAAGLTQGELGRRVFVSGGYIGQFEQAIRKPQKDVAARIDEVLQTDGFFERMWKKLIADSPYDEHFASVAELERLATKICEYTSTYVPGLLQTSEYVRALFLGSNPLADEAQIEDMVRSRMGRTSLLKGPARPVYWGILPEAALRIPVGGPAVMARQLDHLAAMARERKVLIQVLPFSAGAQPIMGKMVTLMEFEDAPPTAYTEAVLSGNLLDDPATVKRIQGYYDLLRAAALSPEASLALIESVAEDYRRCANTT